VAQAFLPLLARRSEWLGREPGIRPLISGIGTRSRGYVVHPTGISPVLLAEDADVFQRLGEAGTKVETAADFIDAGVAAGASLLIELTTLNPYDGQPALSSIRQALAMGLDVVTANKGPIAHAQFELQELARRQQRHLRFESAVMDGLPLINLAEFTLPGANIRSFRGLLNSTSSLVLGMIEQGHTLTEAIREAQRVGVTEADPWYDLDGWDAAMKTTILANTLLEGHITPQMVTRVGIRDLALDDICAAALSGSPIRLVSRAWRKQSLVVAEVGPQQLAADTILHAATGKSGILSLETEAMGTITLIEHEPTVEQTAYGVFSDLVTIVRQKNNIS
jgi:homoserine dehydrogenase